MINSEEDETVNHFVTMPIKWFQILQGLKVESGSRTWLQFYGRLTKAKEQNLLKIDWDKIKEK